MAYDCWEEKGSMLYCFIHLLYFCYTCRLINERELQLFDGTRLLGGERFNAVKEKTGLSEEELAQKSVHNILNL